MVGQTKTVTLEAPAEGGYTVGHWTARSVPPADWRCHRPR